MNSHKLVLIGDGGVGKTTLINKGLTDEFERKYIATQGFEVNSIIFPFDNGQVTFEVRDIAGQEKYGDQKNNCEGAECAIVMFDVTNKMSYRNVGPWIKILRNYVPDIPIILCGSKCDIQDRKIKEEEAVTLANDLNLLSYFDVSAKTGHQIADPFLYFIEHFHGQPDMEWVG